MSSLRRNLGLDWIDLVIHLAVTGTLLGFVGVSDGPLPREGPGSR